MRSELVDVDIVDADDNIVGSDLKTKAHDLGYLHRIALGIIIDSQNRWLLVKQAADRQDPGQLVCPVGGHVRTGESYEQALRREAKEEVDYDNFEFKLVGKTIYNRFVLNRQENHYFALHIILSDQEPILNHESVTFQKFTKQEIIELLKLKPELFGDAFKAIKPLLQQIS